jgi:hypothetical protein
MTRWIVFAGIASIVSGCGEPAEKRAPVYPTTGKITFQGKPLPGALVLFRKPEADPDVPSPTAITGDDGSFTLHTYEPDDGAPAGDYQVSVSTAPQRVFNTVGEGSGKKSKPLGQGDVLNGHYADPKTSGLKATIKTGTNTLETIDLTETSSPAPAGRQRIDR